MTVDIENLISNYAFPIAIAIYLLYRDSKKMDTLIDLVKEIKGVVAKES